MKKFSDLLSSLSPEDIRLADMEMSNSLSELNGVPVFLCTSNDPQDAEALKVVIEGEDDVDWN